MKFTKSFQDGAGFGLRTLRVNTEKWKQIWNTLWKLIQRHADRFGFLYSETLAIGLVIVWILIQYWVRWPAAYLHLNMGILGASDSVFDLLMFMVPLAEWGLNTVGAALFGIYVVGILRDWASQSTLRDLDKDEILHTFEEIAATHKNGSESESPTENAPELSSADLVYLGRIMIATGQIGSMTEDR